MPADVELRRQAESLLRLPAAERARSLLTSQKPMALVRALPDGDFYLTVREVDPLDALPLLALASASQIAHLLDLESWRRDRFDPLRSGAWVALLVEAGEATIRRFARTIDDETLILLFRLWARVKPLEIAGVAANVIAVAELRIEVDEVREHERRPGLPQELHGQIQAVFVRVGIDGVGDPLPVEDVLDLPDRNDRDPCCVQAVEHGRARRRNAEVPPLGTPLEGAGRALERTRDHPPNVVLARQEPTREPAPRVQLLERDDVGMGRDLEDRITARVDDREARPEVLLAELLDDLRPRRGDVPEHPPADRPLERLDDLRREPFGVQGERTVEPDPHHLPVPRGGVLAG
jgi:hypothetical protein